MPRPDPAVDATARLAALDLGSPRRWPGGPADAAEAAGAGPGPDGAAVGAAVGAAGPRGLDRAGGPQRPAGAHARPAPVRSLLPAPLVDRMPPWLQAATTAGNGPALVALAAACAVAIAVVAVLLLRSKGPAAPTAAPTLPPLPVPAATAAAAGGAVVVDVGGRVRHPGLVTLPPGSRVADAVRAAGGALRHRDLRGVNLAAHVADGQLLMIGAAPAPAAAAAGAGATSAGPVNLNSATVEQLDELPGIGPVLAQRIVDWRTAHGGFTRVEDLEDVSGIGDSTYADLQPLVTV